ncbi:helix-turn-helix domain-containing protein [Vibrio sp. H11]|uniref:helix-turn-helix domain-containing protein n=1 Tax=Vibrio sp. H11 TaxID=2565928 RepID=UPI0010A5C146|nr:helix-turn-helix domain-containing protein [Vibrio sp. H11]
MLREAITSIGVQKISEQCNVSVRAVYKWCEKGVLPRTEYTGETHYAEQIEELSDGKYSKDQLLNIPR